MTRNLWSEERDFICLNCARRIVTPRRSRLKYGPLHEYLGRLAQFTSLVTLPFSKIEGVINENLPFRALRDASWWDNSKATPQGQAWTGAGWRVQSVDLSARRVKFKKETEERLPSSRKKRREPQQSFTPVPVKARKTRRPSKTRIARAVARARNIERRRAGAPYTVKAKHTSAYQKKLYKPEAKPSSQD
jgi:hypothetical protein